MVEPEQEKNMSVMFQILHLALHFLASMAPPHYLQMTKLQYVNSSTTIKLQIKNDNRYINSERTAERTASNCNEHTYSDHSWRCLPQPRTKRRGEGILRMEDDFGRRRHRQSGCQHTDRPRPSSPELFNKDHNAGRESLSHLILVQLCIIWIIVVCYFTTAMYTPTVRYRRCP